MAANVPVMPMHTKTLVLERNAKRAQEGKPPRPVPEDTDWAVLIIVGILRNPSYAG